MLGIADEDGWVQILDSRKTGSKSVIKGMCNIRPLLSSLSLVLFTKDLKLILDTAENYTCQSHFVMLMFII